MSAVHPGPSAGGRVHPGTATLRVLAALLGYPDARLRGHLPEMTALLAQDNVLSASRRGEIDALARWLAGTDPLDAETAYVETFDRGRATSLYLFEHVHDIRAMTFVPKPHRAAYEGFFTLYGIDPTRAVMFDDLEKNLVVPHDMGMATVQVVAAPDYRHEQVEAWELDRALGPHVHHVTDDLARFLRERP